MTQPLASSTSTRSKLYALLIGINEYLGGVPSLRGCVNDVRRMDRFLAARTEQGQYEYLPLILTSGDSSNANETKPTRRAIIDGFRQHLADAGECDIVLFYYSGHGSQEKAPPQFWHIEPDHLDETIVCYDSRTEGGWDLADKELALLIAEVAQKKPHILVILDACHSGSGTRAPEGIRVRLAPTDQRERPLDQFLEGTVSAAKARPSVGPGEARAEDLTGDWFALPQGRHIVFSACQPEESAREKLMADAETRGVFSFYLLDTLQQAGPGLSYQDVAIRVKNLVQNTVTEQNPVLAATTVKDLRRTFLDGALPARKVQYFTVAYRKNKGWLVDAGAIHGIIEPVDGETTVFTLFPSRANVEIGDSLESAIGTAKVINVGGGESRVEISMEDDSIPDEQQTYKAFVTSIPLSPIPVFLAGNDQAAHAELHEALKDSLIVREVIRISEAAIVITADQDDDSYRLRRAGDLQPLSVAIPLKGSKASLIMAQSRLEHMAQWMRVLTLDNKQSPIPPDAIAVEFYHYEIEDEDGKWKRERIIDSSDIRLSYSEQNGEEAAHVQIRLINRWTKDLYCMLVDLTDDFAIRTDLAFFGDGIWLKPGEEVWATNEEGERFVDFWVPDEICKLGVTQVRDTLKLIVGTDESRASYLHQDELELVRDDQTRGVLTQKGAVQPSTLDRLMQRVQNRAGGMRRKSERLSDFRTAQFTLTTSRFGGGVNVPHKIDQKAELAPGVFVQGLPGLQANVRLETLHEGAREMGNLALPALFRSHPELGSPFSFLPSRGGDAGMSTIVLSGVSNQKAVTPETPLVFCVEQRLGEGELVVPVGFDSEANLSLPLGYSRPAQEGIEIQINYLPPLTSDSRSLKGSIKLFFQKVVGQKLGPVADLTRLAVPTIEEDGHILYESNSDTVAECVRPAERILLCIHGFLGDTREMVRSLQPFLQPGSAFPRGSAEPYDLILTFDYENISTPIESTARKLKQHLSEIGLGPNHGKTLHVVAHSLGCLVARWFIEQQAGHEVVTKAILAGPPNGGTPWATIEDYALVGLGTALNGLATLAAPAVVAPALVGALSAAVASIEKEDHAIDQVQFGSTFYDELNASDDPEVQYVVIAGDTARIVQRHEEQQRLLGQIAMRLSSQQTRNRLLSVAFFGQPNDNVTSVTSMIAIPKGRNPKPLRIDVGCDFASYFSTEVGLQALNKALS